MSIYNNIRTSFQEIISSNLYFVNLHYLSRYISIITKFKNRNLVKKEHPGYHKHHIIPRCIKGNNEEMNLVTLSPREHYIVHHLLWKAFPQTGLTYAFRSMVHETKQYGFNKITSKVYEKLCLNDFYNKKVKTVSEETKRKISEANNGRKHSEESKLKMSNSKKGSKQSEETIRKRIEKTKGQKRSEETRQKMSEATKNRPKNKPKTIWVCNTSCSRRIHKDLLDEYLSNEFILGMKFNKFS